MKEMERDNKIENTKNTSGKSKFIYYLKKQLPKMIFTLVLFLSALMLPSVNGQTASSASSSYEKYVQENMIPSLGKALAGTRAGSGDFLAGIEYSIDADGYQPDSRLGG